MRGLASLLAGNNTAVILAMSLALAVLSASALGHFAATHVFAPLIGHTSQAFMIASIGVSIALQEIMRLQGGARDLWMMPLFDGAAFRIFDGTFPVQIGIMQIIAVAICCCGYRRRVLHHAVYGSRALLEGMFAIGTPGEAQWREYTHGFALVLRRLGGACKCFRLDHRRFLWRRYFFNGT